MVGFESAVLRIAGWLATARIPYMAIGGFANLVWGEPRLTRDLDVMVSVPPDALREAVERLCRDFPVRVADPSGFVDETRVLPLTIDSVPADIIFASLPYEEQAIARAVPVEIPGGSVFVCSPEDLILHKIVSPRPRDHDDLAGIFRAQGKALDLDYLEPRIEELAAVLEDSPIRNRYLELKRKYVLAG